MDTQNKIAIIRRELQAQVISNKRQNLIRGWITNLLAEDLRPNEAAELKRMLRQLPLSEDEAIAQTLEGDRRAFNNTMSAAIQALSNSAELDGERLEQQQQRVAEAENVLGRLADSDTVGSRGLRRLRRTLEKAKKLLLEHQERAARDNFAGADSWRESSCLRKTAFERKAAVEALRNNVRPYLCDFCGKWHAATIKKPS